MTVRRTCDDCKRDTLGNTYQDQFTHKFYCARHALLRCSDAIREQRPISFRNVERDAARTEQRGKAKHATLVLKVAKGSRG